MITFPIHVRKTLVVAILLLLTQGLTACSSISYYAQAVGGHWEVMRRSQPIEEILAKPDTPDSLRHYLSEALQIRAFAHRALQLPDNRSYTYYADLQRPSVLWSVFATPTLSLMPKQWCVPLLGCMSYRGYFSQQDAQQVAAELRGQDYDVYVANITAYSTIGWFNDPVLNTMLGSSLTELASVIFHELAHQQLYIAGDTAFNESFAVAVEELGVTRWLLQRGVAQELQQYQVAKKRQAEFRQLILSSRDELQQIYQRNVSRAELQQLKAQAFEQLRQKYATLKQDRWQNYRGYDRWFEQDLNNAKLLSVVTYHDLVPAFHALFKQQHEDFEKFYQSVAQIAQLPIDQRHQRLRALKSIEIPKKK